METKNLITAVKDLNCSTTYVIDSDIVIGCYAKSFLMTAKCFAENLKLLTQSEDVLVNITKKELVIELKTPQTLSPILRMLNTFAYHVRVIEEGVVQCYIFIDVLRKR